MPANVVKAMEALSKHRLIDMGQYSESYKIGINSVGSAFEEYVKDLLTGRFYPGPHERTQAFSNEYSWLGNQNFPPDAIAAGGDAFEIKKHEKPASIIALNSSHPRDVLSRDDPMLTQECRDSMGTSPLDLFYIVGTVTKGVARSIYFVQGKCYAASSSIYQSISSRLSDAVRKAMRESGLQYSETRELGRINRADPLGRASLRVRGMWQIQDPSRAFAGIAPPLDGKEFFAYAIMEEEKYISIGQAAGGANVAKARIPSPNNPARPMDAVVMEVSW
ncbi:NgoPII family restriction endonuclease [Acidiplasma sp. MBA-1]|uniref:NgoPII family restriction endonuclease n=1 Tax=Acidiplasma sp. MBA-1 TaxID=1293648 RepID=UPI0005DE895D|nr:NgoPII family restriction endonuclease [Acidiplasma sp. MBA-1]KJE49326.1 hypothetical protein TZ01_04535 [Acidiplasma sp. MBA-1]